MSNYRLPSHLICLGGGGTEIGTTFLNQDWILEEVIRDSHRESGDGTCDRHRSLDAFLIDTDTSNLPDDIEERVAESADRIIKEYDIINPGEVRADVINLTVGPQQAYLNPAEIVAPATIGNLMREQGLDAWWLEKDGNIFNSLEAFGLGRGVRRKRGLMKAIYRISQWGNDDRLTEVEKSVASTDNAHAAMVVGLGGGTGSGLCLDLARRIKLAGATVTLFGILPAPSRADRKELANAYATLSELEYLALSDENYFTNIILLPYVPAEDGDTFDKAAVYTITSYYNLGIAFPCWRCGFDETESDGPPKYAPFTLASTRYLHYIREDILKARENFAEYCGEKQAAIDAEKRLYDALEEYIISNYPDAADELYTTDGVSNIRLENDAALYLIERADDIRELLNQEFMKAFEFQSTEAILDRFDDLEVMAEEAAEWDEESDKAAAIARELIRYLPDHINSVEYYEPEEGWATDEEEFVGLVLSELEIIARRAGILRAAESIDASGGTNTGEAVSSDIRLALDEQHLGLNPAVEHAISDCEQEIQELETELEKLETALTGMNHEVRYLRDEWRASVAELGEQYYTLVDTSEGIENRLTELQNELTDAVGQIAATQNPNRDKITGTEFDKYSELNRLLERVDGSPVDKEAIEHSVVSLQKARQRRLQADSYGLVQQILPTYPNVEVLQTEYREIRKVGIDSSILTVASWEQEFDVSVNESYFTNRLSEIETRRKELLNEIADETEQVVQRARDLRRRSGQLPHTESEDLFDGLVASKSEGSDAASVRDQLEQSLVEGELTGRASSGQGLCSLLEEGPVDEHISAILSEPLARDVASKRDELERLKTQSEAHQNLRYIVKNEGQTYAERAGNVPDSDEIANFPDVGTPGPFKMDVKPRDRGRLGGTETLGDTGLWDRETEQAQLLEHLYTIMPELTGEHLPVNKIGISYEDTAQVRYEGYRAASVFMSPMFEKYQESDVAEIEDVKHSINDGVNIKEDKYLAARGTFADAYDFAMTTFLTGVFLDNLQVFTDDCRDAYLESISRSNISPGESRHNHQQQIPSAVEHHTYGLDGITYHDDESFLPAESSGGFCYRRDILDLFGDGEEILLDQAEESRTNERLVAEKLRENYWSCRKAV